eukprot:3084358-Prymnesium_polylepis.2
MPTPPPRPAPTLPQCNLYGLSGSGGESVGSASFTGFFQLFNHACCPNLVFDCASPERATDGSAPTFALMAAADIAEGTELCISCERGAARSHRRPMHASMDVERSDPNLDGSSDPQIP